MDNPLKTLLITSLYLFSLTKYRKVQDARTDGQKFISPAKVGEPQMSLTPCSGKNKLEAQTINWNDARTVLKHYPCNETTNLYLGKCRYCCDVCTGYFNAIGHAGGYSAEGRDQCTKADKHWKIDHNYIPKKTHKGNGAPSGAFAFTLTKSPDDDLTEEDMIKAVTKVMNQKSCPTIRFVWYIEYGDVETRTHPHIHGMYETESGGRIEAKHWKRAWMIWDEKKLMGFGFRGGYHRPVRSEENYVDYVQKCADVRHGEFNLNLTP